MITVIADKMFQPLYCHTKVNNTASLPLIIHEAVWYSLCPTVMHPSLQCGLLITRSALVLVGGFFTELSCSGGISRLVHQVNGLRRALLLLWLLGLSTTQGLVPLSFSTCGRDIVQTSMASGSCVMALRGTRNILGALGEASQMFFPTARKYHDLHHIFRTKTLNEALKILNQNEKQVPRRRQHMQIIIN